MGDVYIEERMTHPATSLSWDLAHHLYTRGAQGHVIILTDKPSGLHASLRKQWMVLLRQVQRQRSSTLQSARIIALSRQIAWMQRLSFSHGLPDKKQADIRLLTANDYMKLDPSPPCDALYIVDVPAAQHAQLVQSLRQGIIVIYK